jgi:hypothetical protein
MSSVRETAIASKPRKACSVPPTLDGRFAVRFE